MRLQGNRRSRAYATKDSATQTGDSVTGDDALHSDLCRSCRDLDLSIDDFIISRKPQISPRAARKDIIREAYLSEIYSNDSCPLCRLITQATRMRTKHEISIGAPIGRDGLTPDGREIPFSLGWQQDGRKLNLESSTSSVTTRRLRITSDSGNFPDAYIMLVADNTHDNTLFLGRPVTSSLCSFEQIKLWISICQKHHGPVCNEGFSPKVQELVRQPWFRVIDTEEMRLVQAPNAPFVALSYCWGSVASIFRATKSNFDSLLSSLPEQALPRTIRDSIWLAKQLGQRYIWVDSICIIQDAYEDWEQNARIMNLVYGSSVFTICAASGADCDHGLDGLRETSRRASTITESYRHGMTLMASRLAESYISTSPWNQRAWTFQERLTSKRCLILVDGRVYFQCQRITMSEDVHSECFSDNLTWYLDFKDAPLRIFQDNPLRQYSTFVKLYTKRILTFRQDTLPAFSAIAELLSFKLGTGFFYGLPIAYFDWALLWQPVVPGSDFQDKFSGAPTWSWAYWIGGVDYLPAMVHGTLLHLHDWLMSHTWITWYTSESGKVFPLWDGKQSKLSGRWSGYKDNVSGSSSGLDSCGRSNGRSQTEDHGASQALATRVSQTCTLREWSRGLEKRDGIIYFSTWSAFLCLSRPFREAATRDSTMFAGLKRFGISDARGEWCGVILLEERWAWEIGSEFQFVAISDARDFTLDEYDSWTYYVPKEREDSEWDLYNVLLVREVGEPGVYERVGLGKVYKDSFNNSFKPGKDWRTFALL